MNYRIPILIGLLTALFLSGCATRQRATLLQKNPANPHYFANADGQAVFLTGSHTWNNLQDKGPGDPPESFDWNFYLRFLQEHQHNFIRLWSCQTLHDGGVGGASGATPLPWLRTGPGFALDGEPRLDLTRFNEEFFQRLKDRVASAERAGIYVDIMFFEAYCASVGNLDNIRLHAFAEGNNINGVNILQNPRDGVYAGWVSLQDPEVVRLQELYVRKVVETVNEFDNVLFEIANEPSGLSHEWQEHFIGFVRACEAGLPKQHMVGSTGGMKTYNHRTFASSADWVSPDINSPEDPQRTGYKEGSLTWGEPDYDRGDKVVILDTDHLWGLGGNTDWVWKSFCRGYNVIYMDPASDWPGAFFQSVGNWSNEPNQDLRREMGIARAFSERMDLNRAVPRNELSSTGYCLAEEGRHYLAYQAEGNGFSVQLIPGSYQVEWHFPDDGSSLRVDQAVKATGREFFLPPGGRPAVLFLSRL